MSAATASEIAGQPVRSAPDISVMSEDGVSVHIRGLLGCARVIVCDGLTEERADGVFDASELRALAVACNAVADTLEGSALHRKTAGEDSKLDAAISFLEGVASGAEFATDSVHFHAEAKEQLARDIRTVVGALRKGGAS